MNPMTKKLFDIIMYTNASGLGVGCGNYTHRLGFIRGVAKAMEGIGNVLVVLRYRSIPQYWFEKTEQSRNNLLSTNGLSQLGKNLWTMRPTVIGNLFLSSYIPFLRWQLHGQIMNQINHTTSSLNMINQRVAWMTHPYHYLYRGCARESAFVYECYDEHVFNSRGKRSKRTELLELELAKKANLNIATSKVLFDKLSTANEDTILISNGVMFEIFSQCQSSKVPTSPKLKALKRPVIGMIGTLYHGYDFELLDDVISRKKEWSFVFVGGISENARADVAALSRHHNFYVFGWRPYHEILPFLKGFDVAIIPYKITDWTNTINPNKLYDYLAAGVPVVATTTVELCRHKECVTLYQNKDEFIDAIEKVISGESEEKVRRGIRLAKALSWDSIAKEAISELTRLV